jgi:peptidyl-prolyl cis-trans isomerase C
MTKRLPGFLTLLLIIPLLRAAEPAKAPAPAPPLSAAAAAAAKAAAELFPDEVCARGNGVEVKRSQLAEAFMAHRANLAARGQVLPEDQRQMVESRILDRLVVVQILMGKAQEADKAKGRETMEKLLAQYKAGSGSDEVFQRQLQAMGMSLDQLRSTLLERAICDEVLDRELKSKQVVSDDQAKKYYDQNPERFEQPEMVRVSHILISTRDASGQDLSDAEKKKKKDLAEKVLKRARGGEDFAKLVAEFSEDPGSKDKKGEYTFPRGRMVPEFEASAFALGINQISDLVTSKFGYHIIKKLEKIPAGKVELAKVHEQVKETLLNEEVQKKLPDYLEKLKKEAIVEILDPNLQLTAGPPVEPPAAKPAPKGKN